MTRDPAASGAELRLGVLDAYRPRTAEEAVDVERIRALVAAGDAWSRRLPLHVTGSAVVVHPPTQRVLLRWHERMQGWLQVGGHADPGETDPLEIALREAREETGLSDLLPWPAPRVATIFHVTVVPVPAGKGEPAHHNADIRYVLSTDTPDDVRPESDTARLQWMSVAEAISCVGEDNLRVCLQRIAEAFPVRGA